MRRGTLIFFVLAAAGCSGQKMATEHPVKHAVPPLGPGVYTVAQVDVRPVATHEVEPDFPPELGSILTGRALVVFTVRPNGKVADAAVVDADDRAFGQAALEAISRWRFRPAEIKGTPVACRMTTPFVFDSPYGYLPQDNLGPDNPSDAPPRESYSNSVLPR